MIGKGTWLGFADFTGMLELSLDELVATKRMAKTTLAPPPSPGTSRVSRVLWAGRMPPSVMQEHCSVARIPAVCVYAIPISEISGRTHAATRGRIIAPSDVVPGYVHSYYEFGTVFDKVSASYNSHRIIGPAIVVTNFWCDIYGHFLLESIGRLLVTNLLAEAGYAFPIVISNRFKPFVRKIIEVLSPRSPIVEFDEDTEIVVPDLLLMPGMGHTEYDFHPFILGLIDKAVAGFAHPHPGNLRKLYVSRTRVKSELRTTGRLLNEPELQAALEGEGWDIVHVQELRWTDQVALFRDATSVIGEQGSGLHNTLFSKNLRHVVSINRMNLVQQRIACAREHLIGFVVPDDGRLFGDDGFWDYTINVPRLIKDLRMLEEGPLGNFETGSFVSKHRRWVNYVPGPALLTDDGTWLDSGAWLHTHVSNVGDVFSYPNELVGGSIRDGTAIEGFTIIGETGSAKWLSGLEYRVRATMDLWSDWVAFGEYVGSKGQGVGLTGFQLRLRELNVTRPRAPVRCVYAGRFEGCAEAVIVSDGVPCVSVSGRLLQSMHLTFTS